MEDMELDSVLDNEWDEVETTTKEESPAEPETEETATETEPADQPTEPELFTLKNRDETKQVSKDDLIAMAQKGWDYDTVRAERDQLRQYRDEADPALALVKQYAERNGMTVGEYLDYCRKQELMSGGLTEQDAAQKLSMEKERAALDAQREELDKAKAQQESLLKKEREAQEARQRDIESFYKIYPNVDPKTIPNEVWTAVQNGDSLTNAYTMHENKRLAAELAAERQNKANAAKAPGSLGGTSTTDMDEIDRMWAEDD